MIEVEIKIRCNRCQDVIAVVRDRNLRGVQRAWRDARKKAEKAGTGIVYKKNGTSVHCKRCVNIMWEGG